jgi:hypothetical protein
MKRLSLFILILSIVFAAFFMGLPLLGKQFSAYLLMKVADVFDICTPLILIPLYWLLYRLDGEKVPSLSIQTRLE